MKHNPHNLTDEQIEVSEGWRLLDEDEIIEGSPKVDGLKAWLRWGLDQWSAMDYNGSSKELTFRTKLTREQLAEAREQIEE